MKIMKMLFLFVCYLSCSIAINAQNIDIYAQLTFSHPKGETLLTSGSSTLIKIEGVNEIFSGELYLWDGVKKDLLKISDFTGNSYNWVIPDSLSGNRFRLKVSYMHSGLYKSFFSDNFFTISQTPTVKIALKTEREELSEINLYNDNSSIIIFPNPVEEYLNFQCKNQFIEINNIKIINSSGLLIREYEINNSPNDLFSFDAKYLASGFYSAIFQFKNNTSTIVKFIKQ
jgi:hypothetical protein